MRMPTRPWSALALAGTVVAVLAVSGCSADPADAPLPDGWVRYTEGRLSVAVPQEWVELPEGGGGDGWTTGFADDASDPTILLVLSPEIGDRGAVDEVTTFVVGAETLGATPGYDWVAQSVPVETDELVVARNDHTYREASGEYEGVFWAACDPGDNATVALKLTAADLPEDVVAGIEESIRVLGPDAQDG